MSFNVGRRCFSGRAFNAKFDVIRQQANLGGGIKRIESQHKKHKLTARERISLLLDRNSFNEIGSFVTHTCHEYDMQSKNFYGDGVITGKGYINNRPVLTYAQDFTVHGGSLSEANANKICKLLDLGMKMKIPIIGLNDSGGARIQEGVNSLKGYTDIFFRNVMASGMLSIIIIIIIYYIVINIL